MGVRPPLRSAAVNELLAPLTAPRQREMYPAASVHISREMPMLRHGRVARYVPSKRYGFIVDALDPSAPDLFVNSASLALGCREAHTLIVGAYVMFRSDSRLVNGCAGLRFLAFWFLQAKPCDAVRCRLTHTPAQGDEAVCLRCGACRRVRGAPRR
jgi:hypothetical protein